MLGNKNSARRAFQEIEQLSPARREKNDTIKSSLKYCVYLKELPRESLTVEEQEFMRTMEQIDAWYEAEIAKAEQNGEQQGELKGELRQAQSLIFRLLNRRVGNVSSEVESRIKALPLMRLEELHDAALDFPQMEDLIVWLNNNS